MKEFRKTKEGHFICEECGKTFIRKNGLVIHINSKHYNSKNYFDKWLKNKSDGMCKICRHKTDFINFHHGYQNCCSEICTKKLRNRTYENTCLDKYNKKNYNNHKKTEKTLLKKYNVKNAYQLPWNREKAIKTYIKKYGTDNFSKVGIIAIQRKYGVDNISQIPEFHYKAMKSGFKLKQYMNTNLYYQGSYELDFLEHFYDKIDIYNGPTISYFFEGKNKVYHSDFYIPSKNLVVEIKSDWIIKLQGLNKIKAKEKATISSGFEYIILIEKKYEKFYNLLN